MNVDNMDDDEEHRVKRTLGNESNDTDKNDTDDASDADDLKKKKEDSKSTENIDNNAPQQDSHSTSNENTSHSNKKTDSANESTSSNAGDTDNTDDDANTQKDKKIPLYDGDVSKSDEDIKNASNKNEDAQDTLKDNKMNNKTSGENTPDDNKTSGENPSENTGDEDSESTRFIPPAQAAKKEKEAKKEEEEPMGLLDHLSELRRRLLRIVIILMVGFIAFYGISELAFSYLAQPAIDKLPENNKTLIFTAPQAAFFIYLKVAFMLSILATSPLTFYQIWAFIAPGLYKEEQSAVIPLALFSAFFFISGAAFCYFLVLPIALEFFFGFENEMLMPMITIDSYFSLALKLIIAFGLVFEMPLFAYFFAKMRILTPEAMRKHRKYAVLGIFIVAAVLTPPDVFSQTLMAIPMLVLYEISIYVAQVARGQSKKKENTEEKTEPNTEEDINDKINNFK